jgi:phage-related protein
MTYPTFPSIPITYLVSKETISTGVDQLLGDGYAYRTQFGLHPLEEAWRIRMLLSLSDAETARSFLEARATDGVPFLWSPPDDPGTYVPRWTVDEWPVARAFQSRVEIDLLLRRRWDSVVSQS